MSIEKQLANIKAALPRSGLSPLPDADLALFAWNALFSRHYRSEDSQFAQDFLAACLSGVQASRDLAAHAWPMVNPLTADEDLLELIALWVYFPSQYKYMLANWAYRLLLANWRLIQKHAGLPEAVDILEANFPFVTLTFGWAPTNEYIYRRRVSIAQPITGLTRQSVLTLLRAIVPPSIEIEISVSAGSMLYCAGTAGLGGMTYTWLGAVPRPGTTWSGFVLNDADHDPPENFVFDPNRWSKASNQIGNAWLNEGFTYSEVI